MARTRRRWIRKELVQKSREAALNAVQTFNNPLTTFRTETFIVLMTIAWTYLLHAYYRRQRVEYRYYKKAGKLRRFERTKSGAFKYWELERCLNEQQCPLDRATKLNLHFLIGLRNEIEHHRSTGVDERLSGRYLACCLNYERYICKLFGDQQSLESEIAFTLQFRDLTAGASQEDAVDSLPSNVMSYLQEFDAELSDEELKSENFRCRFLFMPLVTSKKAQADEVIQFIPANSVLAKSINKDASQVFVKETERPKYLPSEIVKLMQKEGFINFKMHQHIEFWKSMDGKNPGKGFGVRIGHTWYWYQRWVDEVRKHCAAHMEVYRDNSNVRTTE